MKKLLAICFALLLTACGSGMNGTYADKLGMITYTFKPDGKVNVQMLGVGTELTYERDGETLKISGPQGNQLMTIKDKETIVGPLGVVLEKQK